MIITLSFCHSEGTSSAHNSLKYSKHDSAMLKNTHGAKKSKNPINILLTGFNNGFNKVLGRYKTVLTAIVNRRVVTALVLVGFCVGTYFLSDSVPSGFIPNEDQGVFYAIVLTPPGSTLERTDGVSSQVQKVAEEIEGVASVSSLAGYEILSEGTGANAGTCLINLKPWEERKHSMKEIMDELEEKTKDVKGATIEFFPPPAVPGYGAAGGFELRVLDKGGSGDYKLMETVTKNFVEELRKRPELSSVFTFYSASFPQFMLNIDNDKAQQKGISIENAMTTLSTLVGSNYETSFIKYDRQYKVMVQALPEYRALPDDILKLYCKNDKGEMVPFSTFMTMDKVYGLSEITRHNMYNASEVSGDAACGFDKIFGEF